LKIKENDIVCEMGYYKISKVSEDAITVLDLGGQKEYECPLDYFEEIGNVWSADEFNHEEKCPITHVVEKLMGAGIRPFTVTFLKGDGVDRSLRGHFIKSEPILGRSIVIDLDLPTNNIRQVDHRSISSLILDGVKYVVK